MMELTIIILSVAVIVLAAKLTVALGNLTYSKKEFKKFIHYGDFYFLYRVNPRAIEVLGEYLCNGEVNEIIVKRYHYRDDDAKTFAIICAEELVDKLNERI